MGFLDNLVDSFKNSAEVENPFDTTQGGLMNKLGSSVGDFFGDVVDSVSGAMAPLFANKEQANTELMSINPIPLVDDEPESIGMDARTADAYPTMTHIRNWVRAELIRRESNIGLHYTDSGEEASDEILSQYVLKNGKGSTGSNIHIEDFFREENTIHKSYRGPKTSWCRVTSNGIAKNQDGKVMEGFVMHGVDNFNESYGFDSSNTQDAPSVLGYDVNKKPHTMVEPDFKHRPPPGVTQIESEDMGVATNHKKTTINFVAWSRSQVDYLDPFFFQPGNSICVEWGWNFYPREALLDVANVGSNPSYAKGKDLNGGMKTAVNNLRAKDPDYILPKITDWNDEQNYMYEEGTGMVGLWNSALSVKKHTKKGRGNYSFVLGMISNFSYALRADGGYDCTVEITSVSYLMSQLENSASASAGTPPSDEDTDAPISKDKNIIDLFNFVDTYLLEAIEEQDEDPDDSFIGIGNPLADYTSSYDTFKADTGEKGAKLLKGNGRYFSFGYASKYDINVSNDKQYMAASTDDGRYLTVGWLIDIFNAYFARKSAGTNAKMFEFTVANARCVAHPNIKSLNGDVLLIPNALSPRTNLDNFKYSSIGIAGYDDSTNPINNSVAYDKLNKKTNSKATQAFIGAVKADKGIGGINSLDDALKHSPRDDLHKLMTLHRTSEQTKSHEIRSFPDYEDLDSINGVSSEGYSGRIQDLYVNYEVVKDAVKNNTTAHAMLKTILQKMSEAAGGIWDFDLVGEDPDNASNCVTKIIDRKFTSNNIYEIQQKKKAFIFHAHKKNSIVRSMSADVSITGDIAGQVLFEDSENPDSAFYARGQHDRILKVAKVTNNDASTLQGAKEKSDSEIPDATKFIVGIEVDTDEGVKTLEGVTLNDDNEDKLLGGGTSVVSGSNDNMISDTYVVDVEFVEPNAGRAKKRTTKDKNPKNCIKYNMPLDTIELSLEIDGIEGIRLWDMFNCTGVPTKYYMNGLWRVTNIKHSISDGDWATNITAQFCPNALD